MHTAKVTVRRGILALLLAGPKHGYQIKIEYDALLGAPKPLNVGQVYSTLERLARNGLVVELMEAPDGDEEVDGRRRRFELTEDGRDEMGDWFANPVPFENVAGPDELSAKVMLALGSAGVDELDVIRSERTALVERLQSIRREMRAAENLSRQMAVDAAAVRLEADIGWLDRCEERIRGARADVADHKTGRVRARTTRGKKA
jgi:DNA-binding PadR family transcriptional regulator